MLGRRDKKPSDPPARRPMPGPGNTEPVDQDTDSASDLTVEQLRDKLFQALKARLGEEADAMIRRDFAMHVEKDPEHGLEHAYQCLTGKLIDYIDMIDGINIDEPLLNPDGTGLNIGDFSIFRK